MNDINYYMNNIINKENISLSTYIFRLNENKKSSEKIEKDINNLKTNAITFKLNKCSLCNMTINFPLEFFYCGHSFHKTCLNGIIKNVNENETINNQYKCPICKQSK